MGATVIFTTLKGLWDNVFIRYLVIAVAVMLLAWFGLHLYGNKRYEAGIAYQTAQYEEIQKQLKEEYQRRLDAANADRLLLNDEIAKQKQAYAKLQSERQVKSGKIQTEVNNYGQTSDGLKRCLDPKWMQLYKDSLPE